MVQGSDQTNSEVCLSIGCTVWKLLRGQKQAATESTAVNNSACLQTPLVDLMGQHLVGHIQDAELDSLRQQSPFLYLV